MVVRSKKLLIITPGARPIFSGKPGAVELLIKQFILENERQGFFDIDFVGRDKIKDCATLRHANALEASDGILSKNIRGFMRLFFRDIQTSYEKAMISAVKDKIADYDYVLIEGMPRVAMYLRPLTKAKIVTHIHSDTLQSIRKNSKQIGASTDGVIAVSNYIASKVLEVIPGVNVKTVYNCQNQVATSLEQRRELKKRLKISDNDRIILFVGRMSEQKGLMELITAFNELPYDETRKLLIVANSRNSMGWLNNIKQCLKHRLRDTGHDSKLTSNLDLKYIKKVKRLIASNKNIIHVEYVDQDKLATYYDISSMLVVPSLFSEAFGNILIEGGAHALPIIASNVGGIPEIINEKTGILIDTESIIVEIRDAIMLLENNQQLRQQLSRNALSLSKKHIVKRYYLEILDFLEEIR